MNNKKIYMFDSSLRDGAQAEGISFSVEDKLRILKALDRIGINYIEAGNPGSNPKDKEFFQKVKSIKLNNSKITAFGSTCRNGVKPKDDVNIKAIVEAETPTVAIFGKSWDFHITDIIKIDLNENLKMINETIKYLKSKEKEVIFDAEHFFDGCKNNKEYAFSSLKAAIDGGVDFIVLCDTNGGTMPHEVYDITKEVVSKFPDTKVGIHCHNDSGVADANSIMAVKAGAIQVQGTYIGFGERCGNANLSIITPNLQLKMGYKCIKKENIESLTLTARKIAEIANITLSGKEPYVGKSAFAHKGGMHIDGVQKASKSFEHINPQIVGNQRRILMSEVAGRSTIVKLIQEVIPHLDKKSKETKEIMSRIKELEHQGYQFEGAESSVRLLIRKHLGKYRPFFTVESFKTIGEKPNMHTCISSSAMVKVKVNDQVKITAAEGDGPVNALDKALRNALEYFYPEIKSMYLTDFKVRVIDTKDATAAKVRVLIETADGEDIWANVGVSTDVIEASLIALIDSIEYKLIKDMEKKIRAYNLI